MLPWLAPLSLATAGVGLLVYYGRGLMAGLVLALTWTSLGVAVAPLAIVGGLVAYAIFMGRRILERDLPPGRRLPAGTDLGS
jgi:hypothetical protein